MAIRPVASLYTVLLELRIVPIPSTELQTLRQQGSVSPYHWLCPFYPGAGDRVTARIADDWSRLFWEIHLIPPGLGRRRMIGDGYSCSVWSTVASCQRLSSG
jgi:hypothetical protein